MQENISWIVFSVQTQTIINFNNTVLQTSIANSYKLYYYHTHVYIILYTLNIIWNIDGVKGHVHFWVEWVKYLIKFILGELWSTINVFVYWNYFICKEVMLCKKFSFNGLSLLAAYIWRISNELMKVWCS